MAVVTAIRWNAPLRAFTSGCGRDKKTNMAFGAVTRKLIVLANALLHADCLWQAALLLGRCTQ